MIFTLDQILPSLQLHNLISLQVDHNFCMGANLQKKKYNIKFLINFR